MPIEFVKPEFLTNAPKVEECSFPFGPHQVAIHEAGHAIVGKVLGYPPVWLELYQEEDAIGGSCWFGGTRKFTPFHDLMVNLAGEAAELLYFPELTPRVPAVAYRRNVGGICLEFKSDAAQVKESFDNLKSLQPHVDLDRMRRAAERSCFAILSKHAFVHKCLWLKLARLEDLKGEDLSAVWKRWDFKTGKHLEIEE